jgi:diguanylate cyclase (GGDEF)-like protein
MKSSSWLIRDGLDRERMLDMDRRLRKARPRAGALVLIALFALGPWYGLWLPLPLLGAISMYLIVDRRISTMRYPEYAIFCSWFGNVVLIAATFLVSGAPTPLLAWAVFPITPLVARFSTRGVMLGLTMMLITLTAAVALAHDGHFSPPLVIAPAGVILAVGTYSFALMQSDAEHRGHAVTDPLTGLFNRMALDVRCAELAEQSRRSGEPVGVILCDIDHFKAINDKHGHATGDAVLVAVAKALQRQLRAFDLAYRLGGEEFLVLMPGADVRECAALADRLHGSLANEQVGPRRRHRGACANRALCAPRVGHAMILCSYAAHHRVPSR